jgi:hypothetical protein
MRLVYEENQRPVLLGDTAIVHNEKGFVSRIVKPHKPASTGRVEITFFRSQSKQEFFPSVIGADWIEREDRPND